MTEPDPHLLPDGSTSWGPDRPPRHTPRYEAPLGRVGASSTLEPTDAMVEAALGWTMEAADWSPSNGACRRLIAEVIAAAPPEWLLRAALSDKEIGVAVRAIEAGWGLLGTPEPANKLRGARALRGGEET